MRVRALLSAVLILSSGACIDRINFDIGSSTIFPVVIDGYISDQPGPYRIEISKGFDIESKISLKTPIAVKQLVLSDDQGTSEQLTAISQGVYQTSANGIRGTIGRAYQLRIELLDGRQYESKPDTLLPSGKVDRVYFNFRSEQTDEGATRHGFDVFFDSSTGAGEDFRFLWKFIGTYKVETNPELFDTLCVEARCPKPLPCSGYVLDETTGEINIKSSCECCTCWIDFFNDTPMVSDNQLLEAGQMKEVKAAFVPVNQWTFMHQVHAEVRQMSLSQQAFDFWKAVKAQKAALGSLFQPLTGKVPGNFVQTGGPEGPIEGLFFATSISSNAVFISKKDVPNQSFIPPQNLIFRNTCVALFPHSSTKRPDYWED